ncbi:hypothetical protein [Psychromonas sp.]|uniref:PKD domain-containing protein n=1 Tax=Psychromonas sp. TaxID=1884585 RepID=UPI00356AC70C
MTCIQRGFSYIEIVLKVIRFHSYAITAILVGISLAIPSGRLMAYETEAILIQSIDTSIFPSPDPSGIVYLPVEDAFLVTDGEVNELDMFKGVNVFKINRDGKVLGTFTTIQCENDGPCIDGVDNPFITSGLLSFSDEPNGITINPDNNHCFISDDTGSKSIYEIDPGTDGLCFTVDDSITPFRTGIADQEDVTYGEESLFFVSGVNNKVYRMIPSNGTFADVLTNDDELYNSFDTASLGIGDPEGIVFDSRNNTLFIVGHENPLIIQTTTYGVLLGTIDISAIDAINPSGLALVISSEDPSITRIYMVDRGLDNVEDPNENDGKIYELEIPVLPIILDAEGIVVSAGEDQSITLPDEVLLSGSISDDAVTSLWSKYSGPGEVVIAEPNNLNTTVSFSVSGNYELVLTGYDGERYNFDVVKINVSAPAGGGGGGSIDMTLLLFVASAFLLRRRRKGRLIE